MIYYVMLCHVILLYDVVFHVMIYTYSLLYIYIHIYTYIHICICIYIYSYIYIYIYVYTQSAYQEFGFQRVRLKQTLNSKWWDFSCP